MKQIGKIGWKSPSNIALVKYWGKIDEQIPQNPSLSMTLSECHTVTSLEVFEKQTKNKEIDFEFLFEGKPNNAFHLRVENYLTRMVRNIPDIKKYSFKIESRNNFPHSAGVASSASSMSALALCLNSFEDFVKNRNSRTTTFYNRASNYARLGSGSASRSIYGGFSTWGKITGFPKTDKEHATPLAFNVHEQFWQLRNTILIISDEPKSVSSSVGHNLMNHHPFAQARFTDANKNIFTLLTVLEKGDFKVFAEIVEHEALSLHAMMLSASPWFTLMAPNTLAAIEKIKQFREVSGAKITFTMDAGPNVHAIYPKEEMDVVMPFIKKELAPLCVNGKFIDDKIGEGPELLFNEFDN